MQLCRPAVAPARRLIRRMATGATHAAAAADAGAGGGAGGAPTAPARTRLVVVVGPTGVGKTRLSVALARAFDGEVVNADAMQVYAGLPIATAKVTPEEAAGVPHHVLSTLQPWERADVREWRAAAARAIDDIRARGRLPIVVGGTMYYVQALINQHALLDREGDGLGDASDASAEAEAVPEPGSDDAEAQYERLKTVDPVMARRLHPNDTRKVRNALRSFDKHGVPHSERLAAQAASAAAGDHYGATAPPYDARLLWLDCAPEVHAERLSARVDGMVEAGLLRELRQLRALLREHFADKGGVPEGFTSGLLQAIGYKEFAPYLDLVDDGEGDGVGEGEGEGEGEARAVLAECVERLKRVTRRYAKKQRAWIRNRFIARGVPLLRLDTSDVSKWDELVQRPAEADVRRLLAGEFDWHPTKAGEGVVPNASDADRVFAWRKFDCEVCGRTLNGEHEWNVHLKSRAHARRARKRRREEADAEASAPAPAASTSTSTADE